MEDGRGPVHDESQSPREVTTLYFFGGAGSEAVISAGGRAA